MRNDGVVIASPRGKTWLRAAAIVAILFGLVTIREGGNVLFGSDAARAAAGHYVPFVLWFNFLAGFVYVVAGIGLWRRQRWATILALAVTVATLAVYVAFGVHVATGGAYEMRTVYAMALRTGFWFVIWAIARRFLAQP